MNDMVTLRDGVEWRHVEQEVLALDTGSSTFFNTNRAGAVLWAALAAGGRTRAQLADTLVAAYRIDADVARRDVDAFLDALARHGLLA
jgi:hypothetical protein